MLKKTSHDVASGGPTSALSRSTRSMESSATEESKANGSGGGNLAASLAAALSKRKGTMGEDSDEEVESDDEWD